MAAWEQCVFGGIAEERLQLNEDTFWSGRPHSYAVEGAVTNLAKVRELLFAGKNREAVKVAEKLMGKPVFQQGYQPLADLNLRFEGPRGCRRLSPRTEYFRGRGADALPGRKRDVPS